MIKEIVICDLCNKQITDGRYYIVTAIHHWNCNDVHRLHICPKCLNKIEPDKKGEPNYNA